MDNNNNLVFRFLIPLMRTSHLKGGVNSSPRRLICQFAFTDQRAYFPRDSRFLYINNFEGLFYFEYFYK